MFFEFKIWKKDKIIDSIYYKRRFCVDIMVQPIAYITSHYIELNKESVKCTKVEFNDGCKVLAVDQYTAFVNSYKAYLDGLKEKDTPSAN